MGLPNSDVIMKRFVPVSLSAALSLAALLPLTATPLLAHDDDRYDNREYLYSPEISAQPAAWGQQNSDTNSCIEGSVIGGLLGAGLGAALLHDASTSCITHNNRAAARPRPTHASTLADSQS